MTSRQLICFPLAGAVLVLLLTSSDVSAFQFAKGTTSSLLSTATAIRSPHTTNSFIQSTKKTSNVQEIDYHRFASVSLNTAKNSDGSTGSSDAVPSTPLDRPILSLIDTGALLTFAAVGKASHAPDGSIDVAAVLVTAFPFLLSWFLVAPFMGSFTPEATRDVQSSLTFVAKSWILAVPLGCILRGVMKGYLPPIPFVVVTLIATLVILSIGRAAYTAFTEVLVETF